MVCGKFAPERKKERTGHQVMANIQNNTKEVPQSKTVHIFIYLLFMIPIK